MKKDDDVTLGMVMSKGVGRALPTRSMFLSLVGRRVVSADGTVETAEPSVMPASRATVAEPLVDADDEKSLLEIYEGEEAMEAQKEKVQAMLRMSTIVHRNN